MADPLSIAAACVGLLATATRTSVAVTGFVRTFRDARHDLAAVSRQLGELSMIVGLLSGEYDDASAEQQQAMPVSLRSQICSILANCGDVLAQLEAVMARHEKSRTTAARWALKGKDEVTGLERQLDAHVRALNIALEVSVL